MKTTSLFFILTVCFVINSFVTKSQTKLSFKDGVSQLIPQFNNPKEWIVEDLWVETNFDSDGDGKLDRMHVSVTRPKQTETEKIKLPIVYNTSPYFAGVAPNDKKMFWDVNHELGEKPKIKRNHSDFKARTYRPYISSAYVRTWVPRGYIVVHSSSPGTGLSDGSPTIGGKNETLAPKAVIQWLCGKAKGFKERRGSEEVKAYWSTGKVGMIGVSYNGTLALAAATTGVEGLKAIIPCAPNTSYYHYYRSNGLVRSPGGYVGEDVDVLYDFIHSGGNKSNREYSNKKIRDEILMKNMDRITGDYNSFWASRDYIHQLDKIKAATFMCHGFNDWNVMPEHSYRIYKVLKSKGIPCRIYYHQRGHGGLPSINIQNKWFTRYLHGIQNNVEKDPKALIVRENSSKPTPYKDYPNPSATNVKLYLEKGGNKLGKLTLKQTTKKIIESFTDNANISSKVLANSINSENRLIYLTPVLKEDIHISGVAKINIKLSCNKPAANLSVWLISLPWQKKVPYKINNNIITRGWADPQNHKSLSKSNPLEPNKFYTFSFELMPDDQIIPKGQSIALMIFSSDKDFTIVPKPGTKLNIDINSTILTIPIVGGKMAYQKATK